MAKDTDKQVIPDAARTNPSVDPKTGKVNPSAPTTGTEGWGNTRDERQTLSDQEPSSAGPTRATEHEDHRDDNQAARSRRTTNEGSGNQTTEFALNTSHGGNDRTFRCADAGNADCRWETSASTDEDVVQQAMEHARTEHGWGDWTEALQRRVRDATRERRAA